MLKWIRRLFRRKFDTRRCRTCGRAASSKECRCAWRHTYENYGWTGSYGAAFSVWQDETMEAIAGVMYVWEEQSE